MSSSDLQIIPDRCVQLGKTAQRLIFWQVSSEN
jgi:hypothetical protein